MLTNIRAEASELSSGRGGGGEVEDDGNEDDDDAMPSSDSCRFVLEMAVPCHAGSIPLSTGDPAGEALGGGEGAAGSSNERP
jgi:hypothetical protein